MPRVWDGLALLLATVFGTVGCASATISPRPPKHPEEITVPPLEEAKFSSPPKYPEETLNQDATTRPMKPGLPGGPGGPPGAGGMGGMGGMGRGMGSMGGMSGMGGRPY